MESGHFVVTSFKGSVRVERFFVFEYDDEITLRVTIKADDGWGPDIKQLHRASLQKAIDHLQALLTLTDAVYPEANAALPRPSGSAPS